MNTLIDAAILAVSAAAILHLAICFVAKYGLWLRNGRSFTAPQSVTGTALPCPDPTPSREPVIQVLPPEEPRLRLRQHTLRQLRAIANDFNQRLGKRHPNRVAKVARLSKDDLIEALLPRFDGLRLPAIACLTSPRPSPFKGEGVPLNYGQYQHHDQHHRHHCPAPGGGPG